MAQKKSAGGLVYSTDHGRMCPACRRPLADCICRLAPPPAATGPATVRLDTGGRGGKAVTVVQGLPLDGAGLAALGKQLRQACGSGGTVKDGKVELQGDHVAKLLDWLGRHGHAARRKG